MNQRILRRERAGEVALPHARFRERNISHAGMLPAQAPLGFPVAH